jgi:hypothetical protein
VRFDARIAVGDPFANRLPVRGETPINALISSGSPLA